MRYGGLTVWARGPGWSVTVDSQERGITVRGWIGWPPAGLESAFVPRWYADALSIGEWDELMAGFVDRVKRVVDAPESAAGVLDEGTTKKCPNVVEMLTARAVIDGRDQARYSVGVFVGEGVFKCRVTDKVLSICCFVAAPRLEGLWKALEDALADEGYDWRLDRFAGSLKASRVKKKGGQAE